MTNSCLQALEGEEDLQDVVERAREKNQRRAASKLLRESEGQSSRGSPAIEERGRKGKKGRKVDLEASPLPNGKRKRGNKAASVTPSLNEDDEDSRDQVSNNEIVKVVGDSD